MFNLNRSVLRQALDLSPAATIIVDTRKPLAEVVYANQAFEAISGFDVAELIGVRWEQLLVPGQSNELTSECGIEIQCHHRLGVSDHISLNMLPLYDQPGSPRFWMGIECAVPEAVPGGEENERDALLAVLRDARVHLRQLDGRDSTTGILNRRAFDDILSRDWGIARREQRALTLILFKLDCFNEYREVFGRHAADACLQKVAHAITGSLRRASDLVARFADDQFSVLVAQSDEEKVREFSITIAAKVRGLSIHHPRSSADRFITVSSGVASVVPGSQDSIDTLIERATLALQKGQQQDTSFGLL
jgi:diguanylate cyclase (GGDEF)-like protein